MDNSKGIDHAERSINNLGKALNVVSRKVKANRKSASGNEDSIKEINKEMTYVKTQVVEFCGYQSSWGEEVTFVMSLILCAKYDDKSIAISTMH